MDTIAIPDDLITPRAAARLLALHQATVYKLIAAGRLPAWTRAGTRKMVSRREVMALWAGPSKRQEQGASHAEAMRELRERGWV